MHRRWLKWRSLAVALAVFSLGAPWVASWGECREPACGALSAPRFAVEASGVPGMPSCPCPASCEPEPAGGCTQACNRELDSISGRQLQLVRRGTVERLSPAAAVDISTAADPPAPPDQLWAARKPLLVSSTTAPLFIRHRSIIR